MADSSYMSMTGAQVEAVAAAGRMFTAPDGGEMHLFKAGPFLPNANTTLAEFVDNEADYDGYAAAVFAVAWAIPVIVSAGWMTYGPTETFAYVDGATHIGNSIQGYWLQDKDGNLVGWTYFSDAEALQSNGQAVIRTPTLVYRAGV